MRLVLIVFFICIFTLTAEARVVTDDRQHKINLTKPAERIISLAPDITETLFAIGAGTNVIGVVSGSDYPNEVRKIPAVGSYTGIDIEKIISLKPDLIVTWSNTFTRQLNALKKFGIPIYTTEPRYLEDIPRSMKNLGMLTGKEEQANSVAEQFSQRLLFLRTHYQAEKPISVFYQIGAYSLITINKASWINQAITLCGGRNVFAEMHRIAPEVSWESLVVANPQVILSSASNTDWQKPFQKWPEISAVKNGLFYSVNPDWMNRAGPRLLNAVEMVCQYLSDARSQIEGKIALKR